MASAVSGLAASIRNATESETFDLAGQSSATIITNIRSAFAEPLPLDKMIRITFITGAGKLGRQKYDPDAAKSVTSTLREVGYNEDKGASAVLECAGSFKLQHDTGKNLKTVVVFPLVSAGASNDAGVGMQKLTINGGGGTSSLIPESSPEHSIAFSSMTVFERMVASKCQTWTQKKGCNAAISSIIAMLKELEGKLLLGTALTDSEQSLYDSVSTSALEEKQAFVKKQMQQQIDDGKLTPPEKMVLLEQVGERMASLKEEKEAAEKEGKTKRVQQLSNVTTKVEERKSKLEQITPKSPPPLKHEAEIAKLRKEIEPLLDVEEASKGRLLSLKETQALGRKEEIESQIEQLEIASREWFEEDDAFNARVQASKAAWIARMKAQSKKKKSAGSSGGSAWATAPVRQKAPTGAAQKTSTKPKAGSGGGVFAQMRMDSDSD